MTKRLHILHKLPTPYNDEFFRALQAERDIQLQVYHLWRGSSRRPWTQELGTGYSNYYMQPCLGLDGYSLRQALSDRNSLFVVGDWGHLPALALILARLTVRAPVALWVDTPQEHLFRPIYKRLPRSYFLRWLLRHVDVIFGSGGPARRVLIEMGARPESIIDLQFLVDLGRPAAVRARPECVQRARQLRQRVDCESGCVFLMAGTIDLAKKAQDLGLRAFARVAQSAPRPVGLLVAGAGAGEAELKRLAVKLGVEHSVAFLGWQEPDDMDVVFLASDVLVHPAHYDPFPLVVIEAMSFGCAVIGSDHCGSIEERVTDGINGYSFPAGDADALIGSMQRLVLDLSHLASVKREARKTAETWPMDRGVEIVRRTMDSLIHREHR